MKLCSNCNVTKSLDSFYKKGSQCKECILNKKIQYYKDNKDSILEKKKQYHLENRDKNNIKSKLYYKNNKEEMNEYNRNYVKEHRSEINEYVRNKKSQDILFSLSMILRNRTRNFISSKGLRKNMKFTQYIGCSLQDLKIYLESKFQPGMTWDNRGYYGWHIDHIIPLSSAKSEEELYKLCHYTNLQPLWSDDNWKKGAK